MRAPGGGASCLGVGRPGSGALPPPTARPLGGLPGPTTHWLWVRGGAGMGTRHQPHSARSCVLWGRHEGARGGASCLGVGSPGSGALPPPTARPPGGLPGPTTHWLWVRGVAGVGIRHQPHSARSCGLDLRAVGAARGRPGGRLLPGCGASGVGRSPTPNCPPSGRAAGAHYPLPVGAGGCGRGDPSPTPQRALLRAGFARCGGSTRAPGGGASCLGVGRPGSGALPPPTARPLGGLPGRTTHWLWVRGGAGVGTRHQPHSARSCVLWGRHEGARGGRLLPGCGASRVGHSPTPDCPPSGPAAGAHHPLAVGAGGGGCGDPSLTPQRALLRAGFARWGGGMRVPGGGASCLGVGCPGSGTRPNPTARALASCLCALWGRHEGARGGRLVPGCGASGVGRSPTGHCRGGCGPRLLRGPGGTRAPGGGASCLGVGRPGSGALPPPTARPPGGLPGPTTHWLWVRGVAGVGIRHQPHSARSCELALRAVGAARGRPWGGASCLGVGRPGSGALPPPTARPLGGLPGPTTHWLWVLGGAGVGTRHQPQSARSCKLALRAVGAARGRPGGGASCLGVGRPASGAPPPPTARPLNGLPGPTTHWLWVRGGAGVGTSRNPTARALASWLCALLGGQEGARGGRLLPGCGASAVGRSPTPDCPPSGRAAGAHYPLAVGAGGCGRGGLSPTPQRALLQAGFARCGGGTRAPGGGASCLGVGRPGSGALPARTARPLGGLPGRTTHWLWVRGGAGVGTRHQPLSARSCVLWGRHEGARGGRLLPGCGASRVGRSPAPDCPPSARAARAHYPLAVGAGGGGCGDPSPTPQRALLRAGFARCGGGMRVPGGGASCLGVGRPGSGALPPPTAGPLGGLPGPTTHWLWVRGMRAWGPVTNPTARALACCGGGMRVPGGGASCLGVGRPGSGALPPPAARPLGGLPRPTTHWLWVRGGAGVGTRHQPHSARSCELALRAVGAARGRPGGAPLAWVWGLRGGALSHPRLPALWAACRGPLPTGYGCGGVRAWGPVTNPTARALASWLCALWGGQEGTRGGGASCLGVGRPRSGALPTPTARPVGGLPGPTTHWLWVRGGAGVGACHQPHSARSCKLSLRAFGAAQGRPGGVPPAWMWGVQGRALSHPRLPALWAGCRGRLPTGCGCGGVRAWGPVTNPTARALACGRGSMRVPRGGASCLGVGRPGSGALPPPTARPRGGLPGPTPHWLWVQGGASWGPVTNPTARALASWLCALWGRHEGARGGRLLPGCGASWVRRSPTPDCPPSGRAAGAHYPLAVGAGGCGRGDPSPTHQQSARSC